jgi:hypothetical protein
MKYKDNARNQSGREYSFLKYKKKEEKKTANDGTQKTRQR